MVNWTKALDKIKRAIDYVQDQPILNEIAQNALELVPIAGPVLVKYYDKYKDSKEVDPIKQILETLKTMNTMNEYDLEKFCKKLDRNENLILENQNYLREILADTKEILEELKEARKERAEIKTELQEVKDKLTYLTRLLVTKHIPKGEGMTEPSLEAEVRNYA